jgi:hypothetical protein
MQETFCPMEDSVLLSIRTGQWGEGLHEHVSACPQCSDVAKVAGWMAGMAERLGREATLPDPTLTWLKAQLEEHQHVQKRRLRRVVIQQALVRLGAGLMVLLSVALLWPSATGVVDATRTSSYGLVYVSTFVTLLVLSVGYLLMLSRLRGASVR